MAPLPPLCFHNGNFRIMVVGDLHMPFAPRSEEDRRKTADTMKLLFRAADVLRPDLAVFAGDQGKDDDEANMRAIIRRITAPFAAHGIPYALVFGNHDPECAIPLERQLELYAEEYDKCYTFDEVPSVTGCGNCHVLIRDSRGENDVWNLWFADSLSSHPDPKVSYYEWLHEDQIRWYKETARRVKDEHGGRTIPALWFMHIPVREEYGLLRRARLIDLPFSVRGFAAREGRRFVKKTAMPGYLGEDPACAARNSGIFDAWKEVGDVRAAIFGHDHMNEFAGYYRGILLAQCKTASFHNYTDGCHAGVRMITLDESDPSRIRTGMVHFKELGLKSESLGLIQRHFTDREVINAKAALWAAGGLALTAAAAAVVRKAIHSGGNA